MVIAQMMTLRMKMLQKWMMRLYIVVAPEDFFLIFYMKGINFERT